MQELVSHWEQAGDRRAIFLKCYAMMTRNMLAALAEEQFHDPVWVNNLLVYFAAYYFDALDACETGKRPPAVWDLAFQAAARPATHPMQNLLLGMNAHINYDLVLVVGDLIQAEWGDLSPDRRTERYQDYCKVNDIIADTIDAVQDQVLETNAPAMDLVDRVMGRVDEALLLSTIIRWRDAVWEFSMEYIRLADPADRIALKSRVEEKALQRGKLILLDFSL